MQIWDVFSALHSFSLDAFNSLPLFNFSLSHLCYTSSDLKRISTKKSPFCNRRLLCYIFMDGNYRWMQMLLPDERGSADLCMHPDVTHL